MYKAIKDNKIIAVSDTDNVFKFMVKDGVETDSEHTSADYVMVSSEYVLNDDERAIEVKKEQVRAVRNQYLEDTDLYMIIDFPINEEERNQYKEYRQYLRDYTSGDSWWEENPMDFESWKKSLDENTEKE